MTTSPPTVTSTRPQWDLLDPTFYVSEPHAAWTWMRAHEPVYRDDANALWAVSKWDDVVAVERDDARFVSGKGYRAQWFPEERTMISRDDPLHAQQRGLVARSFTPRAVRRHEELLRRLVGELVDAMVAQGSAEVIDDLAAALPGKLTCLLLGWPEDRWRDLKRWSERLMRYDLVLRDDQVANDMAGAIMEFAQALWPVIEDRRGCPVDDLVSVWTHAELEGEPMDLETIVDETGLFISGGAETTRTVIARSLMAFAEHPDQWELLAREPERIPTAVEEMIRWVTPLNNFFRTAAADTELRGVPIAEGDRLMLVYPSANRDEDVFAEPFTFDVTRDPNPHVAFGRGTHFCLGASLARLELRLLFEELTRRITDLRVVGAPELEANIFVGAVQRLEMAFTAR